MILWGALLINSADQRWSDGISTAMYKEARKKRMNIEANFVF